MILFCQSSFNVLLRAVRHLEKTQELGTYSNNHSIHALSYLLYCSKTIQSRKKPPLLTQLLDLLSIKVEDYHDLGDSLLHRFLTFEA